MNLKDIKKYLRKFFRGEETEEGRWLIDLWYRSFNDRTQKLKEYSDGEKKKIRQELWNDIENATEPSTQKQFLKIHRHSPKRIFWSAKMAAGFIITLLALLSVLYYQKMLMPEQQNTQTIEYRTASNPAGQISQFTLADGSTVWLSATSTLRYPDSFGKVSRKVYLSGEAFFDVVRNPEKPFAVNSKQLTTRVLGTSFNVRVFEDEEDIQVTVATGRVSVEQQADSIKSQKKESVNPITILKPEQQLVFNKKTQTSYTQNVKSMLYTSWKDGKLIFENHSFEEIARRLEHWYGINIHFTDDALKKIRFKVTFENSSLEHALRMLQIIEDFAYEKKDDQVWISN